MAMGTKRSRQKQEELFYASERTETPGHPFYEQLNRVLENLRFPLAARKELFRALDRRPALLLPFSHSATSSGAHMAFLWLGGV